jgi:HTH-type transcriptional regulator/antitoxin HipB
MHVRADLLIFRILEWANARSCISSSNDHEIGLICTIMHESRSSPLIALGAEVRGARQRLGLSQEELALAAGVSTRSVHAIENGKPTVRADVLIRLLSALGYELTIRPRHTEPRGTADQS